MIDMKSTKEALFAFIDAAENSRKYPPNTADALKAAFRLFEKELNDEESNSVDQFREHLEQIYQQVARKNISTYTAASLQTYKTRIQKLLKDYYQYGVDPTKMANWNPKFRIYTKKNTEKESNYSKNKNLHDQPILSSPENTQPLDMNHINVRLPKRPNIPSILIIPYDLSEEEANILKNYIDLSTVKKE